MVIGLGSAVGTTAAISINEDQDVTIADGAIDFDVASHDTSNGLKLGGTLVTATAAELNIMDGVTATNTELNIIDGVTATTVELNYVSGVSSAIQTQLDAKQALDADLTDLADGTLTATKVENGTYFISAAGTSGQVWTSDGDSTGAWVDASSLTGVQASSIKEADVSAVS